MHLHITLDFLNYVRIQLALHFRNPAFLIYQRYVVDALHINSVSLFSSIIHLVVKYVFLLLSSIYVNNLPIITICYINNKQCIHEWVEMLYKQIPYSPNFSWDDIFVNFVIKAPS